MLNGHELILAAVMSQPWGLHIPLLVQAIFATGCFVEALAGFYNFPSGRVLKELTHDG